jgi:phenylpropionate dioxygenase-like ring-hydroxylating dioxygenase large terminal subunit
MSTQQGPQNAPEWLRAAIDQNAFDHEQAQLARTWTLLGLTTDVAHDGDWFRSTLGGRSVFVQRFGDSLRGFENVCAHRFAPLRVKNKGNGPIRCRYHHWQYNKDGLAVGIPKCREQFGVTPRELGARLTPIEIATCGGFVFGRFSDAHHNETLREFLGDDVFDIVQGMWSLKAAPRYIETPIAANWRLVYHVTLDDYHIVAVHPATFGKHGYLPTKDVAYHRLGYHSAYFHGGGGDILKMADDIRRGDYHPTNYRIFQIFPNVLTLHIAAARNWYVLVQQYVPIAPDRCVSRCWYAPAPFPATDASRLDGLLRRLATPFVPYVLPHYIRKIFSEDNTICEQVQTVARQVRGRPIFGGHEERIGWFEDAYAEVVGPDAAVANQNR